MKNALVTGASQGIGRSTALSLLEVGYRVYGTYNRSEEDARELAAAHANLTFHQVDFADPEQTIELVRELSGVQFDGIVNNAGIFEMENFEKFDMDLWNRVFEVNLHAPLRLLMGLQRQINDGGAVVNVSSLGGLEGSFASMAYSASKAALINLTKSLGNNFGKRGIRVNAIAPGWINTGMATEESYQAAEITPLGRNGTPEEVANLITYLLSDGASFMTGETVIIDGGFGNVDYIMLQESKSFQSTLE